MNTKERPNLRFGRSRLLAMAIIPLYAAIAAFAQASEPANSSQSLELDKLVVTGSNIPAAGEALSIPVVTLSLDQIKNSGVSNDTLDIIRKVAPSASGIGQENANISSNSTFGGSSLYIHGLNTLVLVNGQRIATSSAESVNGFSFVDLSTIPPVAIDHIDILQDGASAIYGSDAVGGVINIVLKRNYNGWEIGGHYGFSTDVGHYRERSASVLGGVSNDKTSITVSAQYTQHDPIYFAARPGTAHYGATTNYAGIVDIFDSSTFKDEFYQLNPSHNAPPGGGTYTMAQLVAQGYYTDLGSSNNPAVIQKIHDGLNLAAHQTLIQDLKRSSIATTWDHKIAGNFLEAFGDLIYSKVTTNQSLNAQPLFPYVSNPYVDTNVEIGFTPPPPGTQYVPSSTASNPFSDAYLNQAGDGVSGLGITAHNRFVDYPRLFQNDSTLFRASAGLRGDISTSYSWEATATLSRYQLDYTNANLIDEAAFLAGLADGTLNPFAIHQAPGVLPGRILGNAFFKSLSTLGTANVLLRGTPVELPAGKLAFAIGAQYSREALGATADSNTVNQAWVDAPSILPISKQRKVTSEYAEIEIPILGKEQNIPGVYLLNADLAGRSEDYTRVGSSTVPRVSMKYEPFNDSFALHASAGKSFVAPRLYDLYGPVNIGASSSISYTPYGSQTRLNNIQFEQSGGANPDLKPSKATNWTVGFVYTPKEVPGLTISYDYYQVVEKGLPGTVDQQTLIQSVENLGPGSPYNDLVHFSTPSGPIPTAPGQISTHAANSVWIVAPTINLGSVAIKGSDITADYKISTASIGRFDISESAAVYHSYTLQQIPTEHAYGYVGQATKLGGTVPQYRLYTTLDWKLREYGLNINHTFIPSVSDTGSGGSGASAPVKVSSYSQFDLAASYDFGPVRLSKWTDGLKVRIGVNNVFNAQPPLAKNANPDTYSDIGFYNGPIGRMWFVDAEYKF